LGLSFASKKNFNFEKIIMSKKTQKSPAGKAKSEESVSLKKKRYEHPYGFNIEKLTSHAKKAIKEYQITNFGLQNPEKMASVYGATFSVTDPEIIKFCNGCKGRLVRITRDPIFANKDMRIGDKAANALSLVACKMTFDILNGIYELIIPDKIREGTSRQHSKVVSHNDVAKVMAYHPETKRLGIYFINRLKTRIKIPGPKKVKSEIKSEDQVTRTKAVGKKRKEAAKQEMNTKVSASKNAKVTKSGAKAR
jgi:hypothetical protein